MITRSIVLDANLLLLLVVGLTDSKLIAKHKRLKAFTSGDFDLLRTVLNVVSNVLLTPNTLTETSNLMRQIDEPDRSRISAVFQGLVQSAGEEYFSSRNAVERPEFLRLGLTDAALLDGIEGESRSLPTTDLELYLAALHNGLSAENFNHLREQTSLE